MPLWPEFIGERCVHATITGARCRACVERCARGALRLDDCALAFDAAACDGCGLCAAACPTEAIRLPAAVLDAVAVRDGAVFLACAPEAGPGGGSVPCLDALGEVVLWRWFSRGIRRIVLAQARCDACPRGGSPGFATVVATANRVLASRGLRPFEVEVLPLEAWLERRPPPAVDMARRSLLAATWRRIMPPVTPSGPPLAELPGAGTGLVPRAPEIDAAVCEGCEACAGVCATAAIRIATGPGGRYYELRPERCTGCAVCKDVCANGAVGLRAWGVASATRMPLVSARCTRCGCVFHVPGDLAGTECRVCRAGARPALYAVDP